MRAIVRMRDMAARRTANSTRLCAELRLITGRWQTISVWHGGGVGDHGLAQFHIARQKIHRSTDRRHEWRRSAAFPGSWSLVRQTDGR
jgi:hypothetical protein